LQKLQKVNENIQPDQKVIHKRRAVAGLVVFKRQHGRLAESLPSYQISA
jgi:hypothetical protein